MKYKIGAMWSSDFDYDGMIKAGLNAEYSWGKAKLEKLHNSFEDVNYHTESHNLWKAIQSFSNKEVCEEYLKLFKEDLKTYSL